MELIISEAQNKLLVGDFALPDPKLNFTGTVVFAHGSGSSRLSSRNQRVARFLNQLGIATLLFDLLTPEESHEPAKTFDIPLLANRLALATQWVIEQTLSGDQPIGFFGASTGAAAALWCAADLGDRISAVVSRGGRPDLAMPRLSKVSAATLLIVGSRDERVIEYNEKAVRKLKNAELQVIPRATHLFEEPGTLDAVARSAGAWFNRQFQKSANRAA